MTAAPELDVIADITSAVTDADHKADSVAALAAAMEDARTVSMLRQAWEYDAGAWEAACARMGAVQGCSRLVGRLRKLVEVRSGLRVVDQGEQPVLPAVVPDGYEVPMGWDVSASGIWHHDGDRVVHVATAPIYVTGRFVDADSGIHAVELTWPGWCGKWKREIVPAGTAADARSLVALSGSGAPVTSANSGSLVQYIDASRARNADVLPLGISARRMGWMQGGFLLGRDWIGSDDAPVHWRGDEGQDQLADCIKASGTWEGWLGICDAFGDRPIPWLVMWASVASVLLEYVDAADGATLDVSGETSKGKTTLMRVGASTYGNPDRLIRSWKTRMAGLEAYLATLCHLPPMLDDTKKASPREMVGDVLYMHSGGMGVIRGKPGTAGQGVGMRRAETWRSLLVSTGEERATSFTQDAGARARTLCLVGEPLGSREQADRIAAVTAEHYGHLLPRVVRWLLEPGRRASLRVDWKCNRKARSEKLAKAGAVAGRLGDVVTLLELAGWVCHCVGVPDPPEGCDPIKHAEQAAIDGGKDADRPLEALRSVYAWCSAHQSDFWGRHLGEGANTRVPSAGWAGAWKDDGEGGQIVSWDSIAITASSLDRALVDAGYPKTSVGGIVERWAERGWLRCGKGRVQGQARIGGVPTRVYVIERSALDGVVA